MLRTITLAAFVLVSVSALAEVQTWRDLSREKVDEAGRTQFGMMYFVRAQDLCLQGPDRYTFEALLNRMAPNVENAMIKGLYCAHRQSIMVREQSIAANFPGLREVERTTEADEPMTSVESGNRPMRIVMSSPAPHDIDYRTALEILESSVNATESTWIDGWWQSASDNDRDVISRLLQRSSAIADEPIYRSLYITNLTWVGSSS